MDEDVTCDFCGGPVDEYGYNDGSHFICEDCETQQQYEDQRHYDWLVEQGRD